MFPSPVPTNGVPIIGQPFELKAAVLNVVLQCKCDGKDALLVVGKTVAQCPTCQRRFQIAAFAMDADGKIAARIQQVVGVDPAKT